MSRITTIIFFCLLSLSLSAQSFALYASDAETRINKLKEAENLVASSIQDTEAITATAKQTTNPQQYIDFVVLRYERNNLKIQLAIVQAANEAIQKFSSFIGKDNIDQSVLREGIAKYSDISATSHKFANDLQNKFFEDFFSLPQQLWIRLRVLIQTRQQRIAIRIRSLLNLLTYEEFKNKNRDVAIVGDVFTHHING